MILILTRVNVLLSMRFSERTGKRPIKTLLQIDSIDKNLMNRLWNLILEDFFYKLLNESSNGESFRGQACKLIWKEYFVYRVDEIPRVRSGKVYADGVIKVIENWYFNKAQWHEVYDFIEFLVEIIPYQKTLNSFVDNCNTILKREVSGYRIINGVVVQISSEEEIQTIEEALVFSDKFKSVKSHISKALDYLADRENPDYRNSIKESISSIEALCNVITGDSKATLGKALAIIENKFALHPALKEAYSKIYGYASDASGIRHAILDDGLPIEFEDAKFMLVSCSAFINYLKLKLKL